MRSEASINESKKELVYSVSVSEREREVELEEINGTHISQDRWTWR
jgi:hypothetical protein